MPVLRIIVMAGFLVALGYGITLHLPGREATIANPLVTPTPEPSATVFPSPAEVMWEGTILRTLAGGEGLDIGSVSAPGGSFYAYYPQGVLGSVSEGLVSVRGLWTGTSCEYGKCAPVVDILDLESLAPELQ